MSPRVRLVMFLLLVFSCTHMAYGFYVKMENTSGKKLIVSCDTRAGARYDAIAVKKSGEEIKCIHSGGGEFASWNYYPYSDHVLYFKHIDNKYPFDNFVFIHIHNPDHTTRCEISFRYYSKDSKGYSLAGKKKYRSLFQMIDVGLPCTSDYLWPREEDDHATVHIY